MAADTGVVLATTMPPYLEGLRQLAARAGLHVLGEAKDRDELFAVCARLAPAVILAETRVLGQQPGAALVALKPHRVLLLGEGARADDVQLLMAGALGFLPHPNDADELGSAARRVADGAHVLDERMQGVLSRHLLSLVEHDVPPLTARETEVVQYVAEGLSNGDIASAMHLGVTTVKSHVSNAADKLGVHTRVAMACQAVRLGLVV